MGIRLGLTLSWLDFTYFGEMNFAEILTWFHGKTIILLNSPTERAGQRVHPSEYLQRESFQRLADAHGIRFYIVGKVSPSISMKEELTHRLSRSGFHSTLLAAPAPALTTNDFLQRVILKDQSQSYIEEFPLNSNQPIQLNVADTRWTLWGRENFVKNAAKKIQSRLKELFPERRYEVGFEVFPEDAGAPPAHLGKVYFTRSVDQHHSSEISLFVEHHRIKNHAEILSPSNFLGLLLALDFPTKLTILNRILDGSLGEFTIGETAFSTLLTEAIVTDIAIEHRTLANQTWNKGYSTRMLIDRMPLLASLAESLLPPALPQGQDLLASLYSQIKEVSKNEVRWWEYLLLARRSRFLHCATNEVLHRLRDRMFPTTNREEKVRQQEFLTKVAEHRVALREKRSWARGWMVNHLAERSLMSNALISADAFTSTRLLTESGFAERRRQLLCADLVAKVAGSRRTFIQDWACPMAEATTEDDGSGGGTIADPDGLAARSI